VIVLDTTVLVYATGGDHPLREPCRSLVQAVARADVEATTTVEVVQEFVHVRARRRSRTDAAALGQAFADLLEPLLVVTAAELAQGLRAFRDSERLGAFDAVLAATALAASAQALVSADRAFAGVHGLRHVLPDVAGVAALLSS
jgi:predicted nucleic acid-binding protein